MAETRSQFIANTIRQQIGVMALAQVGAHELRYTESGLTFKARLSFKGQTRVRIMRVTVTLTPADLYDVRVYCPLLWSDVRREVTEVYCDQLAGIIAALDLEGV